MTVPAEEIAAAIQARREWAMKALEGWIRCPSVLGEERGAQEYLARLLEELRWEPELRDVDVDALRDHPAFSPVDWSYEGRPNLVATHRPREAKGRSLVFNGHVDVVSPEPAELWSTPPFEPRRVEDGGETWIQGRGAADMKGGSVCHLWALAALQDLGYRPAAEVRVQSPIEEECTGNGTLAMLVDAPPADACLIPEPFDEAIMIDQVGVMWFQVRVLGSTTHVLQAGAGVNAIEKSWVVIQALRALEEEMNLPENRPAAYRDVEHPFNLNVGVIRGGDWASTVAGECMVRFRIGFTPDASCQEVRARIEQVVAEAAAADPWLKDFPPTVEYIGHKAEPSRIDPECELITTLSRLHARLHGAAPTHLYSTCTTDVRHFLNLHETPATCYGPVGRRYHSADERVSVESMQRVATTMAEFVQEWCGLEAEAG